LERQLTRHATAKDPLRCLDLFGPLYIGKIHIFVVPLAGDLPLVFFINCSLPRIFTRCQLVSFP